MVSDSQPNTVLESLNHALHDVMVRDESVVVLGEDILDPYGGAFKVTAGISTKFPDRVLTTPISEAAIVGLSCGLAMRGMRPVAEIMFGDFITLAADQLINHAAKFRWMYNEGVTVPLVVRTPMGGRRGYGPTHSQSLEKHFLGVPGLWAVAPNEFGSPGDLLEQCVLGFDEPVLFIENKTSYARRLVGDIQGMTLQRYSDDDAPFPTLYLRQDQASDEPDGIICTYGGMASICLEAARVLLDREGLVIDIAIFSQLSPPPITHMDWILSDHDVEVIVYAEEGSYAAGWASEMIATACDLGLSRTDGLSIRQSRVGSENTPIASSRDVELTTLPQVNDVVQQTLRCF